MAQYSDNSVPTYQRVAGEAIFEIGKRLKHVKENDLAHGEYIKWVESVGFNRSTAHRFVKVYEEFGSNGDTWQHIGMRALYEIATMPEAERTQPHTIPSTQETKTVDEMTVRELREVKKALKEAEAKAQRAESDAEVARRDAEIKARAYLLLVSEKESRTLSTQNKRTTQLSAVLFLFLC